MINPQRTAYWPKTETPPIWEMTAGDALRRATALAPDRTALVEVVPEGMVSLVGADRTDRRWTYLALLADAEACARGLLTKFSPGEHICVWAPNVPEWVIVQYGAALAGLVVVTANPALREAELAHVLRQSRSVGLITVSAYRGNDMAAIARRLRREVRDIVLLEDLHRLVASAGADDPLPAVAATSPAQIQFTSGTTGLPKGALLHHRGLVTNAAFLADRAGQNQDVVVTPMPLFHTAGSVLGVLGAVTTLSTLVLPVLFEPKLMLGAIERERARVASGVPTMLEAMLQEMSNKPYDVASLKVMISGGAPVPPNLHARMEAVFGCPLVTLYGQTELSPAVAATSPGDAVADRARTSGRPLPHAEVRIADATTGALAPLGGEGEVQVRGYQVMQGYFDQPLETAKATTPDGWLRTGDVGRLDDRGFLTITGRLSDMIIRGGENLYPAEIEAALIRHPAIAEAAVFGLPDGLWGEVAAAAVRIGQGQAPPTPDQLKRHCRDLLAPHKTPSHWFTVDQFPLTASGKVQKFVLRQAAATGTLNPLAGL
jgi:acyl-CoA synthetase (AMP-forming)/AMP-acid ligase II